MTDREFDKVLKKMMQEYRVKYDPASWDDLENRLDIEDGDVSFDDAVKSALTGFSATGMGDWSRMEQELVAEERNFDNIVKEKVESYEPTYDASSWPVLHQKVTENERLRRRLLTAKVLEIAMILIAFVTLYNFFPDIHATLIQPGSESAEEVPEQSHLSAIIESPGERGLASMAEGAAPSTVKPLEKSGYSATAATAQAGTPVEAREQFETGERGRAFIQIEQNAIQRLLSVPSTGTAGDGRMAEQLENALDKQQVEPYLATAEPADNLMNVSIMGAPAMLSGILPEVSGFERDLVLSVASVTDRSLVGLRVGIGAAADLNVLKIPDDIFYSQGRQIKFSAKELSAIGHSAGASVLFDRGKLTFETGLYYSLKQYEPNRVLHIGETFDVRTLDFQQINLNVISVPLLVHYNFDQKGKVRLYAAGGMNMNIIAVAHYDLIVKNRFGSSAAPADPQSQRNSQEVARVREHILDGAEFSSKSYIALSAGFGVERRINHRFSIFGQPTFNYQIPFFGISDQNGKDLQFGSLLIGTRIKLK